MRHRDDQVFFKERENKIGGKQKLEYKFTIQVTVPTHNVKVVLGYFHFRPLKWRSFAQLRKELCLTPKHMSQILLSHNFSVILNLIFFHSRQKSQANRN